MHDMVLMDSKWDKVNVTLLWPHGVLIATVIEFPWYTCSKSPGWSIYSPFVPRRFPFLHFSLCWSLCLEFSFLPNLQILPQIWDAVRSISPCFLTEHGLFAAYTSTACRLLLPEVTYALLCMVGTCVWVLASLLDQKALEGKDCVLLIFSSLCYLR